MAIPESVSRHRAEPAPEGLLLVQDLLDTAAAGAREPVPDLLADAPTARAWAEGVFTQLGSEPLPLAKRDVAALRRLRDAVRAAIRRRDDPDSPAGAIIASADVTLALGLDEAGGVVVQTTGNGWSVLAGAVLAEVLLAQARGDWDRLKLCALPACDVAFYDTSRNRSARWHAARCGNAVNLPASRARRQPGA